MRNPTRQVGVLDSSPKLRVPEWDNGDGGTDRRTIGVSRASVDLLLSSFSIHVLTSDKVLQIFHKHNRVS